MLSQHLEYRLCVMLWRSLSGYVLSKDEDSRVLLVSHVYTRQYRDLGSWIATMVNSHTEAIVSSSGDRLCRDHIVRKILEDHADRSDIKRAIDASLSVVWEIGLRYLVDLLL